MLTISLCSSLKPFRWSSDSNLRDRCSNHASGKCFFITHRTRGTQLFEAVVFDDSLRCIWVSAWIALESVRAFRRLSHSVFEWSRTFLTNRFNDDCIFCNFMTRFQILAVALQPNRPVQMPHQSKMRHQGGRLDWLRAVGVWRIVLAEDGSGTYDRVEHRLTRTKLVRGFFIET